MRTHGSLSRRRFVRPGTVTVAALASPSLCAESAVRFSVPISDDGWRLWPGFAALWEDEELHRLDEVDLDRLHQHFPTSGRAAVHSQPGVPVTLSASVEQYYGGCFGTHPYISKEYEYAHTDPEVINGTYRGVSWFWREFDLPAVTHGKQVTLRICSYRQGSEVLVIQKLTGMRSSQEEVS